MQCGRRAGGVHRNRRSPCRQPSAHHAVARLALRPALWLLLVLLLAACGRSQAVHIADLRSSAVGHLELDLRLELPASVVRGLARGVPLSFRCDIDAAEGGRSSHRRELRFLPLSRQYQLREPASGYSRSYASRSAALAALERWPLPATASADTTVQARVYLERGRLPSPLALSAVFDRDWHLDSGVVTWPAGQR